MHHGFNFGILARFSKNIFLQDNVIYKPALAGINLGSMTNITVDGNVVGVVRTQINTLEGLRVEENVVQAGIVTCTFWSEKGDKCYDITMTNNIVAGAYWAGYTAWGHECGVYTSNTFKNNIAHSVNRAQGGIGAIIVPDRTSKEQMSQCYEASNFAAYKVSQEGAMYYDIGPIDVRYTNMTMIDNAKGIGILMAVKAAREYSTLKTNFTNNFIYGSAPAPDCPPAGGYCFKYDKCGLMSTVIVYGPNDVHTLMCKPYDMAWDIADWGAQTTLTGNTFANFKSRTDDGKRRSIFCVNEFASDYINPH